MSQRVEQLDSLRGLAALTVVLCHHLLVYPFIYDAYIGKSTGGSANLLFLPPFYIFWAGHAAVILFFILSGYVLALPVLRGRQSPYRHYVLKRCCRIYLPYAAAAAGAMLGAYFLSRGKIPELSGWFQSSWTMPPTRRQIIGHAVFLAKFSTGMFNNVIWSLVHELRISLIFPVLAVLIARWSWRWSLAGALTISLACCLGPQVLHLAPFTDTDYGLTLHYAAAFILGGILAKHRQELAAWLESLSPASRAGCAILALVLYTSEGWHPAARMGQWMHPFEYPTAAGAAGLILFAAATTWMRAPLLAWLGRISYSLYLWHLPVLLAIIHLGYGYLPLGVLLAISILSGLVVATIMHRFVEAPAIGLAQWINGRGNRSRWGGNVSTTIDLIPPNQKLELTEAASALASEAKPSPRLREPS